MRVCKAEARFVLMIIAVVLTALVAWGCAAKINYSYDLGMSFGGLKSYKWGPSSAPARQFSLVESNVQFIADQILDKKGFNKASEKPDFMLSINYDYDIGSYPYQYGSQLRMLTLNIYRVESKELIWQGTASGAINTDAASSDLKIAVQDILSKFPPK
jgi:hypothetical protein